MKYYLIAGEASGDLHASRLMQELKRNDVNASFRFIGGDLMAQVGGEMVKHYRELAYMGFIPVLLHLRTILKNMKRCKQDILQWHPDVVILVDYPGFNLDIAKFAHRLGFKVFYYISPKIWAWKEYRIKNIKRDVDELFSILPFEVDFFENKHHYPIHYVGNPTADEVKEFLATKQKGELRNEIKGNKPIIALLAGSRKQEIKDNLPMMIRATKKFENDYDIVLAGAPSIEEDYYKQYLTGSKVTLLKEKTYALLSESHAALVTSGTATLETALFNVPQVVCYETPMPQLIGWLRKKILKVKYISLVNLVADREVVRELVADSFTFDNIQHELEIILDGPARKKMLEGYREVWGRLGKEHAPANAAKTMIQLLNGDAPAISRQN
ncbi:lipid-A-disaccharide synthase [Prevotella sp. E13-17]|uniref:lipid-A-disaccharide synthase n=1 Tax=Prevotella sp. E13-17 TaxID=2913616 RepID=UPI001EDB7AA6|nr:lipid-A-disaccharide synthase [Prevotella sp. E13-17]UKK51761.1 lipid-A-disaccharide synthase [Prevotella sp. E13-17]